MTRLILLFGVCVLAALASGCAVACGPLRSPPGQKLHLDARTPTDYQIRVVDHDERFETPLPADGRVAFDVPVASRHCTQYFLGIRVHSPTPVEKRRVIHVVRGDKVICKLSADDIARLPTDSDGCHVLQIQK